MRYLNLFALLFLCTALFLGGCGTSEESYKKASVQINYEELSQKPDSFKDKPIAFASRIGNVKDDGKNTLLLFNSGEKPILVNYKYKGNEEKFLAKDFVRVWGDFKKIGYKKIDELMLETSVIEIDAKYITRPAWAFLEDYEGYNTWTTEKNGIVHTMNDDSIQVSLGRKKVNPDNIEVRGSVRLKGTYFSFIGIINDDGAGEFEYVDLMGKPIGLKGKIIIKDKNKVEIETPKIERTSHSERLVTINEGKYILTRK